MHFQPVQQPWIAVLDRHEQKLSIKNFQPRDSVPSAVRSFTPSPPKGRVGLRSGRPTPAMLLVMMPRYGAGVNLKMAKASGVTSMYTAA
jgi:hypothetical protein